MWHSNRVIERALATPTRLTVPQLIHRFGERDATAILGEVMCLGTLNFQVTTGKKQGSYQLILEPVVEMPYPNFDLVGEPS